MGRMISARKLICFIKQGNKSYWRRYFYAQYCKIMYYGDIGLFLSTYKDPFLPLKVRNM